jgi:hypothetical protein
MIIKAMAITRCPYCHAIIDEADKYCNNCGTQLLFSEDEEVEEEIPGEKIVDAEVEDKDYTVEEPESEKRRRPSSAKDLDAEIDKELEDELPEGTGKTAIDQLMAGEDLEDEEGDDEEPPDEVILVDEIETSEAEGRTGEMRSAGPVPAEDVEGSRSEVKDEGEEPEDEDLEDDEKKVEGEKTADELAEDLEEEIEGEPIKEPEVRAKPDKDETRAYGAVPPQAPVIEPPAADKAPGPAEEPDVEYVSEPEAPDQSATAGEASLRPVTFDTQELDNLGRTVELGREKIDKFIEVMAAKEAETGPVPAEPALDAEPAPEPDEAPSPPKPPEPPSGALPPWASTMKGAPVFLEDTGPLAAPKVRGESAAPDSDEIEIFPRRRGSDSTIGLPETVSQSPLPFEAPAADEEEAEVAQRREEEAGEEESEEVEEERETEPPAAEEEVAAADEVRPPREPLFPLRGEDTGPAAQAEVLPAGEIEEPAPRPPFSFSVFFKSKAFDVLFVGLFWLVALWLAASSLDATLFDILGSMSGSMILLYAVFVLLYFFLFKFFLGETLGDRLFRPRERD